MAHPKLPVYCVENLAEQQFGSKAQQDQQPEKVFSIQSLSNLAAQIQHTSEPHRHDFFNILFIEQGEGNHVIDFNKYEMEACSVFFLSPGQMHACHFAQNVQGYSILFRKEFFELNHQGRNLHSFPFFNNVAGKPALYLDCQQKNTVQSLLAEMVEEYQQKQPDYQAVLRALLEALLMRLSRFASQEEAKTHPQQEALNGLLSSQLKQLELLIENHYKEHWTVAQYAEHLNVSAKHLATIAKKGLDITISQLIQNRMLLEAKRLLIYTNDTVSRVAYNLNFNEASYFIRFFKKHTGQSPEEFRKSADKMHV